MKKLLYLLPLLLLLTACPVGLYHAPGIIGTEKINKGLNGTWEFQPTAAIKDAEVMKVWIKKNDETSFDVEVLKKGEMYSLEEVQFKAYETHIDDLNIFYLKPSNEAKYYCYQYKLLNKNTLEIADIPLMVGGIDSVYSCESLRKEIKASMKKEGFLKDVMVYKKVD